MAEHARTSTKADLFKWELPNRDFPLYQDEGIAAWQPTLLLACAIGVLVIPQFFDISRPAKAIILLLVPLAGFLVVAHGHMDTIIKRPRLGDLPMVVIALVLTIAYSLGAAFFISQVLGIQVNPNTVYSESRGSLFILLTLLQLFGEEMIKLDIFLAMLTLAYGHTGRRKGSILLATLVTLAIFGLAHLPAYGWGVLQVLLIQGLGSIFTMFCYLRNKNVLTPYAVHLMQDLMFLI